MSREALLPPQLYRVKPSVARQNAEEQREVERRRRLPAPEKPVREFTSEFTSDVPFVLSFCCRLNSFVEATVSVARIIFCLRP